MIRRWSSTLKIGINRLVDLINKEHTFVSSYDKSLITETTDINEKCDFLHAFQRSLIRH